MNKNPSRTGAAKVVLTVAAIYTAVLFLLKKNLDASAWVAYGFTLAATVLLALQADAIGQENTNAATAPLAGLTAAFWVVQFVLGGILSMFCSLPLAAVIIAEAVLTAVYLLFVLVLLYHYRQK